MKYYKGQRVRLTEAGKLAFPSIAVFGTVAHNPYYNDIVSVRSDGNKTAQTWHTDFWKPMTPRPAR